MVMVMTKAKHLDGTQARRTLSLKQASSSETPAMPEPSSPVRTAAVKKSANMPHVIHFLVLSDVV